MPKIKKIYICALTCAFAIISLIIAGIVFVTPQNLLQIFSNDECTEDRSGSAPIKASSFQKFTSCPKLAAELRRGNNTGILF